MFIKIVAILCAMQIIAEKCRCLNLLDLEPITKRVTYRTQPQDSYEYFTTKKPKVKGNRRYWLLPNAGDPLGERAEPQEVRPRVYEDEKDANLKTKISTLVQQTMHDAQKKMKTIEKMKEDHREEAPYRAGFILSMVKKSKDVLDELFNLAVKHRDEWLALEQLKIFEIIVHTNVDTTNLLRQLVDIHVKHLNATQSDKKRVILI